MIRTALLSLALSLAALSAPAVAQPAGIPPGVDVSGLSPAQRDAVAKLLAESYCHCGCPHTLAGCLKEHASCKHAPRMATLAVKLVSAGVKPEQAQQLLTDYYAAFKKKRASFNLKDAGPPLGNPAAKITIVEFSDFTCPFCRALRPHLEAWAKANASRVKLYYRPFFLPSHPRSMESAEAGEFAREKGKFWEMHDALFDAEGKLSDDDLARAAEHVGLSGQELRETLASKRFRPRVFASSAEGKAAGVPGTPALFVNGRRFDLMLGTRSDPFESLAWALDFTLQDEEEWSAHGGAWARD